MQQFGNDGVAWCTIWIAGATFAEIFHPELIPRARQRLITLAIVCQVFLFLLLMIAIPATILDNYYDSTGCVVLYGVVSSETHEILQLVVLGDQGRWKLFARCIADRV